MTSETKLNNVTQIFVILAFASIMVVVAVPAVGSLRDRSRVDRIVNLAEELSHACLRFKKDTGGFAVEFASGEDYDHPRYHELSMPQSFRGWAGPYIEKPLSVRDNPYRGAVYLQNRLSASPAHGFALEGIAGPKSCEKGQFVVFHNVPERIARQVDEILDADQVAKRRWHDTGRVEWAPGGGGSLSICLMDNE